MAEEKEAMKDPQDTHTLDLFGKLEKVRDRWAERQRRQSQNSPISAPAAEVSDAGADVSVPEVQPTAKVLPLWSDETRGVPNGILRSALFGAIRRGRRRAMEREILASVDGVTVRYTGWRLDQADLDVWELAVHLARRQPLGELVPFAAHGFLKTIGRATGKMNHEWLKGSFARLTATAVEIRIGRRTYMGPLIHDCYRDEETGQYRLQLNPKIVALWDAGWSAIDWETRLALKNQPLALWLHGFYSTHAESFPYRVGTLYRLCGSEFERLRDFRRELREALTLLEAAGGIRGWEVTPGDLVKIDRQPNPAQVRHLVDQSSKKKRGRKPKGTV